MKRIYFMIAVCVVGCMPPADSAQSIHVMTPDTDMYSVTCHDNVAECQDEAVKRCGNNGFLTVGQSMTWGGEEAHVPGKTPWYNMLVSCRKPVDLTKPKE